MSQVELKTHYSAAELAEMKLPGMPGTERGIHIMAGREGWKSRRKTKGKGCEYALTSLPDAVVRTIKDRLVTSMIAAPAVSVPALPMKAAQMELALTSRQQTVEGARKGVLVAIERLMAGCGVTREAAIHTMLTQAKAGTLDPHLERMLCAAHDGRGRKGDSPYPSVRSIKGWRALEKQGQLAPKTAVSAVLEIPAWAKSFLDYWQVPSKPSVSHAYEQFARDWTDSPEMLPSIHQVRRFIGKLGTVSRETGRIGPREMKNIKPFDLSVHVPLIEMQNLVKRVPFILEMRNVPFRQQEQITFHLLDNLPGFAGGAFDARGNGQYLAEVAMQRYGADRIHQVMLSESWYREHMPPVKAALEDGDLDGLPKDKDVLADMRAVQIIKGVPRIPDTRTTGEDKGKRHGDVAVGVALAVYASRVIDAAPLATRGYRSRSCVTSTVRTARILHRSFRRAGLSRTMAAWSMCPTASTSAGTMPLAKPMSASCSWTRPRLPRRGSARMLSRVRSTISTPWTRSSRNGGSRWYSRSTRTRPTTGRPSSVSTSVHSRRNWSTR
ncbi:DNA-binding protein [Aquitalea pelogenes]|uniref:DNA-binding protein n=1 Tax=Aquitalea pelogenes TaxID=1293573 RepID=UPI0035ADA45B